MCINMSIEQLNGLFTFLKLIEKINLQIHLFLPNKLLLE